MNLKNSIFGITSASLRGNPIYILFSVFFLIDRCVLVSEHGGGPTIGRWWALRHQPSRWTVYVGDVWPEEVWCRAVLVYRSQWVGAMQPVIPTRCQRWVPASNLLLSVFCKPQLAGDTSVLLACFGVISITRHFVEESDSRLWSWGLWFIGGF